MSDLDPDIPLPNSHPDPTPRLEMNLVCVGWFGATLFTCVREKTGDHQINHGFLCGFVKREIFTK